MPVRLSVQRLLVSSSLFALPIAANAAQASKAARALSPVVVTATRTAQAPFDIAAAVDAIVVPASGHLDINLSELLSGIPGVLARDR